MPIRRLGLLAVSAAAMQAAPPQAQAQPTAFAPYIGAEVAQLRFTLVDLRPDDGITASGSIIAANSRYDALVAGPGDGRIDQSSLDQFLFTTPATATFGGSTATGYATDSSLRALATGAAADSPGATAPAASIAASAWSDFVFQLSPFTGLRITGVLQVNGRCLEQCLGGEATASISLDDITQGQSPFPVGGASKTVNFVPTRADFTSDYSVPFALSYDNMNTDLAADVQGGLWTSAGMRVSAVDDVGTAASLAMGVGLLSVRNRWRLRRRS